MERCIYCQKFILPNNRIALPTSRERRIAFAAALELDEATILNLPKLRYLCTSHFLPTDFYRNDENKITGLQRSALPRQNNPQISENPTFPHLQSFNHLSTVTTAVIPPLSFHPNLSLPKTSITSPTLIMPQSKDIENVPTDDFSNDFDVSDDFGENNDNEINAKINYDKQNEKKKEDIRPKKKYKKFVEPIINLDEMDTFLLNKKKDLMEEEIDEDDDERVEYVVISTKRLLSIFTACPICHAILGNTKKMIKIIGTAASITFRCSECLPNPKTWATQDKIQGTKIYTGNALLSSAAIITPVPFTVRFFF
uniref:THAP-type domain-containing protein n=1 Tax=Panagrolaimus superbus TaxID=310955 RepID=A0A914XZ68_9BILA